MFFLFKLPSPSKLSAATYFNKAIKHGFLCDISHCNNNTVIAFFSSSKANYSSTVVCLIIILHEVLHAAPAGRQPTQAKSTHQPRIHHLDVINWMRFITRLRGWISHMKIWSTLKKNKKRSSAAALSSHLSTPTHAALYRGLAVTPGTAWHRPACSSTTWRRSKIQFWARHNNNTNAFWWHVLLSLDIFNQMTLCICCYNKFVHHTQKYRYK